MNFRRLEVSWDFSSRPKGNSPCSWLAKAPPHRGTKRSCTLLLGIFSLRYIDATIDITLAPMNSDNILVTDRDMTDVLNNVALVHVGDR